ncbi:MAG: SDR family NAD(P)-dependent oxidoreductase [Caldilineaceae bacterium]
MARLTGKVAIITGAAQGLGRAIALRYAEEGCALSLSDLNLEGVQETADLAAKHGVAIATFRTNVTVRAEVDAMVQGTVDQLGGVDILVNNAGIFFNARFEEMTVEQWQRTMDVNLNSLFHVTQSVVRHWLAAEKGGSIVNLSSISAYVAFTDSSAYCVTKAGVTELTKCLAMEFGPFGIRANAMAPGIIATDMTARSLADPELSGGWMTRISSRRYGTPDDVANLALFLASNESSYINGEMITVDGGATFAWPKPADADRKSR